MKRSHQLQPISQIQQVFFYNAIPQEQYQMNRSSIYKIRDLDCSKDTKIEKKIK